jgi:hypothetical protein
MTEYGYSIEVPEGYDEAVLRARLALRGEGFSILSEMHVGGMLGPQTGSERQYLIMGVYDSAISQKRIDNDLRAAVHLPCNLVVQESAGVAGCHAPTRCVPSLMPSWSASTRSRSVASMRSGRPSPHTRDRGSPCEKM